MNKYVLKKHGHKYIATKSGCWEWTGTIHHMGYGNFQYSGKKYPAHWLYMGPRPIGKEACHKCDNKKCINPEHLFWGTRADNMRDMISKKRYNLDSKRRNVHKMHQKRPWPSGENNGAHRLSVRDVTEILNRIGTGITQRNLAKEFRVAESVVSRIKHGDRWGSVTGIQKHGGKAA